MAEETPKQTPEVKEEVNVKGGLMKKILLFGVPAFFVQVALLYFVIVKFVVPVSIQHAVSQPEKIEKQDTKETKDQANGEGKDQFMYVVKDLIINPAGTNGQRYLLTTIAFNVSSEEAVKDLEKKEMAVRDMLNSVLTSKTMDQLIDVSRREALRQEIQKRGSELLTGGKLLSTYFSKYIVQ